MSSLCIRETLATKERESRDAYEFSDKQLQAYHQKLTDAEDKLQEYRARNADGQPGSATDVHARSASLRTQGEQARIALLEQQVRAASITAQLSGESAVTTVQTRETLHRARLIELQAELDRLLLNFTARHPDVVRVRHQMEDVQRQLDQERDHAAAGPSPPDNESPPLHPPSHDLPNHPPQAHRQHHPPP